MNETSTGRLVAQLRGLGFPAEVENNIRLQALFRPEAIEITYRAIKGLDQYTAIAFCKSEDGGLICKYYEVSLRRYSPVPTEPVNGVAVDLLSKSMELIDWAAVYRADGHISSDAIDLPEVSRILDDLTHLAQTESGRQYANELKLRHWEFTPLQKFIDSLSQLKSRLEITQRFFLYEEDSSIVLEEAFRFLNHRWNERKHNAQAKKMRNVAQPVANSQESGKGSRSRKVNKQKL